MNTTKEFIIEIIKDTITELVMKTKPENSTPELWAEVIYKALIKELDIYILTKDLVGKL